MIAERSRRASVCCGACGAASALGAVGLTAKPIYTTDIGKAARADLGEQRPASDAMLQEMEADYNRAHFDRKAPLNRLRALNPEEKVAYGSYLVRSCVSELSGFLLFKELSRKLQQANRPDLSRRFV
jgi:magnesium-protoporphyrin IX monomethyl ester (oxidative) cyclase